jgi:hypothetical protein
MTIAFVAVATKPHSLFRRFLLFTGLSLGLSPLAALAQTDTPVFSVPSGVYARAQTVTIMDATPGAKIYYTTNGTAPTNGSTPYTGPMTVSANETLEAIAFQANTPSALAWAIYTIASTSSGSPTDVLNFSTGFAGSQGPIQFNGSAAVNDSLLQLTDSGAYQAGSAFYATPVTIDQPFTTNFTFRLSPPDSSVSLSNIADGITLTLVSAEPYIVPAGSGALGGYGGALGFTGIANNAGGGYDNFDMALKFDLYNNAGEGPNSTGLYVNGALPTVPAVDLTGTGINLHSGHSFFALVTYDGTANLNLCLTDTVILARWCQTFPVDIPKTIGGVIAYIGFTGGTGRLTAKQDILSWTYVSGNTGPQAIAPSLPTTPDYPSGFNAIGLITNGSATLSGESLQLTDGGSYEAGSAFYALPIQVDEPFSTDFTFRLSPPNSSVPLSNIADGITFALVNSRPYVVAAESGAVGGDGGSLGFTGIEHNVSGGNNFDMAIKFDLYNNAGEGPNSTGLYVNGALPTVPAIDLTGTGIDLHSGHIFQAQIAYDGTTNLSLTLTDSETHATWSHSFPIDISQTIAGPAAYVGFTGGTGRYTAKQDILSWTFTGVGFPP